MIIEEYKKNYLGSWYLNNPVVETLSFPSSSAHTPDILSDECCLIFFRSVNYLKLLCRFLKKILTHADML